MIAGIVTVILLIAFLGGMQIDRITQVLASIDAKLTPLVNWQGAADGTIRYNSRRLDSVEGEIKVQHPETHIRLPMPPPDCKDVPVGHPCNLK